MSGLPTSVQYRWARKALHNMWKSKNLPCQCDTSSQILWVSIKLLFCLWWIWVEHVEHKTTSQQGQWSKHSHGINCITRIVFFSLGLVFCNSDKSTVVEYRLISFNSSHKFKKRIRGDGSWSLLLNHLQVSKCHIRNCWHLMGENPLVMVAKEHASSKVSDFDVQRSEVNNKSLPRWRTFSQLG